MCQKRALAPLSGRNGRGVIRGRRRALGGLRFDDRRMSSHHPSSMSAVTQPGMECASRRRIRIPSTESWIHLKGAQDDPEPLTAASGRLCGSRPIRVAEGPILGLVGTSARGKGPIIKT